MGYFEDEADEEYWLEQAEELGEDLDVDTREGSVYMDAAAGHCMRTAKFYSDLSMVFEMLAVDTCGGDMLDKLDAALRFQQEALNLRAQRQEVLAANIANADTPGYQARDIDFASELKKVMQRGRDATSVVALTMTSTQHIPAQALTPPTAELQYRIPDQPSLDGNTVDMDRERTQFADNSLQYQMSLSALSGQIKGMMNVLQSGN